MPVTILSYNFYFVRSLGFLGSYAKVVNNDDISDFY